MKRMKLLGYGLMLSAGAFFLQMGCDNAPARVEAPPPKVSVAKPELREIADYDQYNGWLQPVESVEIRARVRGHLDKIHFADGDMVKKGDLLFELDPRPFQAEIDRSEEQVKIYQAQAVAAKKEESRLLELVKKGGASQSQVDSAVATAQALEAQIESSKQEVIRNQLDLTYSKITAPISGRIGRALLTVGNLVNAGGSDPILTTISSIDPINVYYNLDERGLQLYGKTHGVTTRPATLRELKIPFSFGLETDVGYPHSGLVDFADNKIDAQTGTIQIRGVVANPKAQFIPGSRVRIRVSVTDPKPALLVPDTAILTDQDKRYVLVVDDKNVVQRRDIALGKLLDDGSRVVLGTADGKSGITANDWIIVQGIQMARINYPVDPIRPAAAATQPASTTQPTTAAAQ